LACAADRHRQVAQARVVALLDGRIERVHVDVDDAPNDRRLIRRRHAVPDSSTGLAMPERNAPTHAEDDRLRFQNVGLMPLSTSGPMACVPPSRQWFGLYEMSEAA